MDRWRAAIVETVSAAPPMGVRQVFYQLVMHHGLPKTEDNYKRLVGRLLVRLRRDGTIPMEWIDDGGGWLGTARYASARERLQSVAEGYLGEHWATQPVYVSVFVEKDGLTGSIASATDPLGVKLWSGGGSASLSQRWRCAQDLRTHATGKQAVVLYLADHDPHGHDIARSVESDLRQWATGVDLDFRLLALTRAQITEWGLPSRPTKRNPHDHVARVWTGGDSTDLDAIPPAQLQALVRDAIAHYIEPAAWARAERHERRERRKLQRLIAAV
jgi:hypothetical protein